MAGGAPVFCHYLPEPQTSKCQALDHAVDSVCSADLSGSGTLSRQDVQHADTDALGCRQRLGGQLNYYERAA